eukprot:388221_1
MHGFVETDGNSNEFEGQFEPKDQELWNFMQENNIRSRNIYDSLISMDLNLSDLTGISSDDLSELCHQLHLSLSDKIKFKKAINTLTQLSLSGISTLSSDARKISSISHHAYYILGDGVSSSTVHNEAKMNLLATDQHNNFSDNDSLKKISVTIVGGGAVGKSSIVTRILEDDFVREYDPTIEDTYRSRINIDNLAPLNMNILDTAGQEEFVAMQCHWIKTCEIILLVYSIADNTTFETITSHWMQKIEDYARNVKLMVLIGNKTDLEHKRDVTAEDASEFAQNHGMLFVETSAKTGYNVKLLIYSLVSQIERCGLASNTSYGSVDLTASSNKKKKKTCCNY